MLSQVKPQLQRAERIVNAALETFGSVRYDREKTGKSLRAHFEDWVLDVDRRELSRNGVGVHLSGKGLQLLELLLRKAPSAVSKEQAYQELWGESFVEEVNIANLVYEIRTALGDDSRNPKLIRTLYRFGYRIEGAVTWQSGKAEPRMYGRAWIVWSDREFPLERGENVVGRDPEARVAIDSAAISRRHARLTLGEPIMIEDLGSKNGTFVNEGRIDGPVELFDGDTIGFGSVRVVFRYVRDVAPTVTELPPSTSEPKDLE
jgi:DNA-binding winged helix-turn-helix (wHTH) protein